MTEKDPSENERVKALREEIAALEKKISGANEEKARLQQEKEELMDAAFFANQHGDTIAALYYDSIRQACEERETDVLTFIRKLPPLTIDFLTESGGKRYISKLEEILSADELRIFQRGLEIQGQTLMNLLKKRSSNA